MPTAKHLASLLLPLLMSCGTVREETKPLPTNAERVVVRIMVQRDTARRPIEVSEAQFKRVVRELLPDLREGMHVRSSRPHRTMSFVPAVGEPLDSDQLMLTHGYRDWCEHRYGTSDCLGLLRQHPYLSPEDRYKVAFDIAIGSCWDGLSTELSSMADPLKLEVLLLGAIASYMMLVAIPEPTSKVIAATLTAVLTAYLGAETLWNLVVGWLAMVEAANAARTFGALRAAGERYGQVIGAQTARVLVMLVMAAISESGLLAHLPGLPGSAPALAALAQETGGVGAAGLEHIQTTQVAESGLALTVESAQLVQGAGVAMVTARSLSVGDDEEGGDWHHIATIRNTKSSQRGGPWTQRFERLFNRAGMKLNDRANQIRVKAHRGPHPEEYHQEVYRRLETAMKGCRSTAECGAALRGALQELSEEIAQPGTRLNRLVTRGD